MKQWSEIRRAAACCAAVVVAAAPAMLPLRPARAAAPEAGTAPARWVLPLPGGAWGLAADSRGAVAVAARGSVTSVTRRGRIRWTVTGADVVEANPALDDALVVVGGAAGVTALDRNSGALRWHAELPGEVTAVALGGGMALAGNELGTLTAYDEATGVVRWSVARPGSLWSGPRVDPPSGSVVASWHGGPDPHVEVLDAATGATRWRASTAAGAAAPTLAASPAGTLVVLAAGDGNFDAAVAARLLATGDLRWRTPVPASFEEAIEPVAGRREVVVVDHFGTVTALDLVDGRVRWRRALDEPVLAGRVALSPSRVVLTTYGGTVTVLGRADGRPVATTTRRRLGGYPVAGLTVRWGGGARYLTGLRLSTGGLALLRVP